MCHIPQPPKRELDYYYPGYDPNFTLSNECIVKLIVREIDRRENKNNIKQLKANIKSVKSIENKNVYNNSNNKAMLIGDILTLLDNIDKSIEVNKVRDIDFETVRVLNSVLSVLASDRPATPRKDPDLES